MDNISFNCLKIFSVSISNIIYNGYKYCDLNVMKIENSFKISIFAHEYIPVL